MNNVLEVDHPVIDIYLTALRDKTTKTASFRRAMANIGNILAYHALSELPLTEFEVETPIQKNEWFLSFYRCCGNTYSPSRAKSCRWHYQFYSGGKSRAYWCVSR